MAETTKEKKEIKKSKNLIKNILIYLPVVIILAIVIFLIANFITKKQAYSASEYEKRLSIFYFYLSTKDTNNLLPLIAIDFDNKENLLPLEKNNYTLFSYKFEVFTNEIESNKVEVAKLLYSLYIQTKASNISVVKEAYFSTKDKKINQINDVYKGKDITKIK
ncbi:MAG: hypothetical protein ACP5QT_08295 [Brevinematia bacterium]